MRNEAKERRDWAVAAVCICLSGFGLSAVPFVGTKYGDWPEVAALAVGLLPLIYIAVHTIMRVQSRFRDLERRLVELERRLP